MRLSPASTLKLLLLTGTAITSPAFGQELPSGGSVAAGNVTISTPAAGQMAVQQSSPTAIVNWQTFSVGTGGTVNFAQPNAQSAILNRVTGQATSTIAGQISANGNVYIVNPNGIAITQGGVVNAGGFVASTLGISDEDFLAGNGNFAGNGASNAVSNAGLISVGPGGYAALIGGQVNNSGTIVAPMGKIGLGAAERVTLDFSNDGFLQVALPSQDSGDGALITNTGTISANGGSIQISAAAAQNAARAVVNLGGMVEARTVSGVSGNITLSGGGGKVVVTGNINASAAAPVAPPVPQPRPAALGGNVTITGAAIELASASIDASGFDGGGNIRIGGDFHGGGILPHAGLLIVDETSTISADALGVGDGGTVVLWSDEFTSFAGTISARGAGQGGNGGDVEVSGRDVLDYRGFADLSADLGEFGNLLLDPLQIYIIEGAPPVVPVTPPFPYYSYVYTDVLNAQLGAANVTLATGGNEIYPGQGGAIFVDGDIFWNAPTTLRLEAFGDININNPIVSFDGDGAFPGSIELVAGGDVNLGSVAALNAQALGGNNILIQAAGDFRIPLANPTVFFAGSDFTVDVDGQIVPYGGAGNSQIYAYAGNDFLVRAANGLDLLTASPLTYQLNFTSGNDMTLDFGPSPVVITPGSALAVGGRLLINAERFVNAAPGAISVASGNYYIYTTNWTDTVKGDLTGLNRYGRTFAGDPPETFGNGGFWLYSARPTLTVASQDASRYYGSLDWIEGVRTWTATGAVNGDTIEQIVGNISPIYSGFGPNQNAGFYPGTLRPYDITSLIGYDFVFDDGDLTIVPAPLTITANSFGKPLGLNYAFLGSEFSTGGLVAGDAVDSVLLASAGAPGGATPGPYAITAGNASGTGLGNYTITYVDGVMTVVPADVPTPPPVAAGSTVADGPDDDLNLATAEVTQDSAQLSLQVLQQRAEAFEQELEQCQLQLSQSGDSGAYISCASNALESFGDAIDDPLIQLPPELKATVTVIRQTVQRMRTAANNTDRAVAVAEARAAVGDLVDFVRSQTALVRAAEPETEALLVQHGNVMAEALDSLDLALVSAVEI